jgi:hypothetical protein
MDDWPHEEADDPGFADRRNFYKFERWSRDRRRNFFRRYVWFRTDNSDQCR